MAFTASDVVAKFAPNAKPEYVKAFAEGEPLLREAGITTPRRLAHFMAQCLHETGALTLLVESGRYSEKALGRMWDLGNWHRYFSGRDKCVAMAAQCAKDGGVALFSLVYGNRMGNGPPETQDGWKYRGRGILQTTGRESYRRFGRAVGVDFEGDPDLVINPAHALKPALGEWKSKNCNAAADRDDILAITKAINGGTVGLDDRKEWYSKISAFLGSGAGAGSGSGSGGASAAAKPPSRERQVQEKLRALGYANVTPDGVIGPITRAAILDYRSKHGLPATSAIDDALLKALGVG